MKLGYEAITEGIEEGQQGILSNRYQRGEYDNYINQRTMFAFPEWFDVTGVGFDAVKNYIGINSGDPDNGDQELRRAMNIGVTTALWFPFLKHMTIDQVADRLPGAKSSYRQYREQMRADNVL